MEHTKNERLYRVGELAKLSGLPVSTLRLWYQQGLIGVRKTEGGHRLFDDRDLRWVIQARDLTQGRYMTESLAKTIDSLVEVAEQPLKMAESVPLRALRNDPNYERMLDLAAQNARLFVEQRELAGRLSELAAELTAAEAAYTSAVERIAECLWSAELQTNGGLVFRLCTPAIRTISGFSPEVFFAEPARWFEIVHPADRRRVEEVLKQTPVGQTVDEEYRIVRADGAERWVRNTVRTSLDETGLVVRLDGVVADVTERKLAELSLRASEQKLRLVVASFPDAVFTLDKNLFYTSALNPINGEAESDVCGLTAWDRLPPDEAELVTTLRRRALDTGQTVREVIQLTIGGQPRYRDMIVSPLRGEDGEIEGVVSYSRDITDRVSTEQELRASLDAVSSSDAFHRGALDALPMGVLVVARDGEIVFANRALCARLGRRGEALKGGNLAEIVAGKSADECREWLREHAGAAEGETNLTLAASEGKTVPMRLAVRPLEPTPGAGDGRLVLTELRF